MREVIFYIVAALFMAVRALGEKEKRFKYFLQLAGIMLLILLVFHYWGTAGDVEPSTVDYDGGY
jgi:hypothetical protein